MSNQNSSHRLSQNRLRLQHESLEARNLMAADVFEAGSIIACYTDGSSQQSPGPVLEIDWVAGVDFVYTQDAIDEQHEIDAPTDPSQPPHRTRHQVTPLMGLLGTVSGHHRQSMMNDLLCIDEIWARDDLFEERLSVNPEGMPGAEAEAAGLVRMSRFNYEAPPEADSGGGTAASATGGLTNGGRRTENHNIQVLRRR